MGCYVIYLITNNSFMYHFTNNGDNFDFNITIEGQLSYLDTTASREVFGEHYLGKIE